MSRLLVRQPDGARRVLVMGKRYDEITPDLQAFIERQPMFFVATAPADGHVNMSPKGAPETMAVLGPDKVAYVDLFGSGIETIAHIRDNGRVTVMWCAFEGDPNIVRVYGTGRFVEVGTPEFDDLFANFELSAEVTASVRAVIEVDVEFATDSCGYVVPEMTRTTERTKLFDTAEKLIEVNGDTAIRQYTDRKNETSIDGLPGLPSAAS